MTDRIAKLLRKAERTEVPEEAEAFTAKAAALMVKHGVDRARVEALMAPDDARREKIKHVVIKFTGSYRIPLRHMASCVVQGLGTCRDFFVSYRRRPGRVAYDDLHIYGHESDVDDLMVLLSSISLQSSDALKRWWSRSQHLYGDRSERFRARRQFLISYGQGVHSLLVRQRETTLAAEERAEPGTALAVTDRSGRLDDFMRAHHPDIQRGTVRVMGGGPFAEASGFRAGLEANVDRRRQLGG